MDTLCLCRRASGSGASFGKTSPDRRRATRALATAGVVLVSAWSLPAALAPGVAAQMHGRHGEHQRLVRPPPPWPHPLRASASRKAAAQADRAARQTRLGAPAYETSATAATNPAAPAVPGARNPMRAVGSVTGAAAVQQAEAQPPPPGRPDIRDPNAGAPAPGRRPSTSRSTSLAAVPSADSQTTAPRAGADPAAKPPPQPEAWSREEIEAASRECDELLASLVGEARPQPPLRQGSCGSAAPVALGSLGTARGGEVALKPAALLNCRMVSRLHRWIETVAQPAAQKHLGARIVKLRNASSYMCRNRYDDPGAKISEHAFANALDVAAFELADGRVVDVRTHWGDRIGMGTGGGDKSTGGGAGPAAAGLPVAGRAVTAALKEGEQPSGSAAVAGPATAPDADTRELEFLKALHEGACGIFTTVLGPLANAAHHDHFHFDLATRRRSAYCQ